MNHSNFEAGLANGSIQYIPDEVYTTFVEQVKSQSVLFGEEVNKDVAIVYSPLNGTGLKPVTRTLKADSYVFGFEESYGYLTGSYVRDKDGVDGAYMICEMFSYEFDGSAGFAKMQSIMQAFRGDIKEFGGKKVVKLLDYVPGLDGLPKSDVLKFLLEDNCSIVVRPSGTEPKLKNYISVSAENREAAEKVECEIVKDAEERFE